MDSLLTTRPSIQARLASGRRWRQLQIELDKEFGTEGVEAAMRAAGADPDAYLASRKARAAVAETPALAEILATEIPHRRGRRGWM